MSRTKKLARNSIFGIIAFLIPTFLIFLIRIYYVRVFGYELLGLQSILATIIGTLSLTELGIGYAIATLLYKPLADKDEKKITLLINLYKKIYVFFALFVLAIGIAIIPLLPLIAREFALTDLIIPYLVTLLGSVLTYLFSFNHTLLSADQNNYIISIFTTVAKFVSAGLQLLVLFTVKDFTTFISVTVVITFLMNILLSFFVKKKYPYLRTKQTEKISPEDVKIVKQKVFALVYHKIGNFFFSGGADNIIISIFLGAVIVGYYNNYVLISGQALLFITALFAGLLASFGNIYATESKENVKRAFDNVRLVFFILYAIFFTGFFVLSKQFLILWLGEETVIPFAAMFLWSLNIFIFGYSQPLDTIRLATGTLEQDKYLQIVLIGLNLTLSIIFVQVFGIAGVLMGTATCLIIKWLIVSPYIAYTHIFGLSTIKYYLQMLYDFAIVGAAVAVCYFLNNLINTGSGVLNLFLGGIVCVVIPVAFISLAYIKSNEIKYLLKLPKVLIKKK